MTAVPEVPRAGTAVLHPLRTRWWARAEAESDRRGTIPVSASRSAPRGPRRRETSHAGLPTHRRTRPDRGPADGGSCLDGRLDRLVLLPAVRLTERLRLAAGRGQGRSLPDPAGCQGLRRQAAVR